MCGIGGWVQRGAVPDAGEVLKRMTDALAHRGPDASGSWLTRAGHANLDVALGHRRLAIIDLTGGNQPMHDAEAGLGIVFNGEIYNFRELRAQLKLAGHRFKTDSDTEVLLRGYRHWGKDVLPKLRGMFAFAVWDARREELFLARDRFGKKPLFIRQDGNGVVFASEIKAILAFPGVDARVDRGAVWEYLSYRYVPGPLTLFQDIQKLAPGSWATWREGRWEQARYYVPPDRNARDGQAMPTDPVGHFLALFEDAVQARMVSDVPFGAFLSGGIDSSAIVTMMARHASHPVKTFSVGFEESEYSELAYARSIAELIGTEHHELIISQKDIVEHLPLLVAQRGAPLSEPSDIPIYCLAREAGRTVKMVLTGEGSDEVLGGYPKHVFERYADMYHRLPAILRGGLIEPLARALPYRYRRIKTATATLGIERFAERMPRWFGGLSRRAREALASPIITRETGYSGHQFESDAAGSALRRILYFDQTSWLPDNLLERGDSMTMAASIEGRMPFMDHELVGYAASLPDHWRVRGLRTKFILRRAMASLLPETILERRKVGFRVPVNDWFRGGMREFLLDHLQGPGARTRLYFQAPILDRLIDEHLDGRQNHEKTLWALLNLEIWHRQFRPAP